MRSLIFLIVLLATISVSIADTCSQCSYPADQLNILSQRSRFTYALDQYINGWISATTFQNTVSTLISPSFTQALVQTPLGNSGPFVGKTAFLNWLLGLPSTTFDGFANHRLVNFIFNALDDPCNPSKISEQNYAPNLLRIRGTNNTSILVWEVSTETMIWVQSYPISNWLINSYYVNSTELFDMAAVDINLYAF